MALQAPGFSPRTRVPHRLHMEYAVLAVILALGQSEETGYFVQAVGLDNAQTKWKSSHRAEQLAKPFTSALITSPFHQS